MTTITCLILWMPRASCGRDGTGLAATVARGTAFTRTAPAITANAAPTIARRIHVVTIAGGAPSAVTRFRLARKLHRDDADRDQTDRATVLRSLASSSCSAAESAPATAASSALNRGNSCSILVRPSRVNDTRTPLPSAGSLLRVAHPRP